MAQGLWLCCGLGSPGSGPHDRGSSSGRSYRLVDEADDVPSDDSTLTALLGDGINPVAQPDGDATKTPASRRQPQGPNRPHALRTEIQFGSLFHPMTGR